MKIIKPFSTKIDLNKEILIPCDTLTTRKLSDMKGYFYDEKAYDKALTKEDSIVYEVYDRTVPQEEGQLAQSITVIHPGKVGNEYYMTKGHFHAIVGTAEVYLCLKGKGYILLQSPQNEVSLIEMKPGIICYTPPYWAHRSINTGKEEFIFFVVYPAHAGHDYKTIEEKGFLKVVVEKNKKPALIKNPKIPNS